MSKPWQPYALHILDTIAKIRRIQARGNLADQMLKKFQAATSFPTSTQMVAAGFCRAARIQCRLYIASHA